jgi:sugar/nucleoside kinase (ribokinase family)
VEVTDGAMTDAGPRLPVLRSDPGLVEAVVVGSAFCDIVFSGLERLPEPGEELWADACSLLPGGTYITAAAVHRFGVPTVWVTTFGSDPFSDYVRACARREGLDERAFEVLDRPMPNLSVSLSFGGERSFISHGDTSVSGVPALIRSLRPRIVIRPGLRGIADAAAMTDAAHEVGAIMFIDPQSTTHRVDTPGFEDLLGRVDVLAPNAREAMAMTGAASVDEAANALAARARLVVVKLGASGAMAVDGCGVATAPALRVRPIETTGAGDCFNAAFIMAMLEGDTVSGCLAAGNAAGGLSTLAPSSAGIPTRAALQHARAMRTNVETDGL